ncbi:MAG: hypothetical protein AAGI37_19500 [Planctomycetota bacterium]
MTTATNPHKATYIIDQPVHTDERGTVYERHIDGQAWGFVARHQRDGLTYEADFELDPMLAVNERRSRAFTRAIGWLDAINNTRVKTCD